MLIPLPTNLPPPSVLRCRLFRLLKGRPRQSKIHSLPLLFDIKIIVKMILSFCCKSAVELVN